MRESLGLDARVPSTEPVAPKPPSFPGSEDLLGQTLSDLAGAVVVRRRRRASQVPGAAPARQASLQPLRSWANAEAMAVWSIRPSLANTTKRAPWRIVRRA